MRSLWNYTSDLGACWWRISDYPDWTVRLNQGPCMSRCILTWIWLLFSTKFENSQITNLLPARLALPRSHMSLCFQVTSRASGGGWFCHVGKPLWSWKMV